VKRPTEKKGNFNKVLYHSGALRVWQMETEGC